MHESKSPSPQLRQGHVLLDEHDEPPGTPSSQLCEEAREPGEKAKEPTEKMLVEQAEALGERFNYDGSVLTPEQRRALFNKYWAMHLDMVGLRSPQHYGHKSRCLSMSETAWPGTVTWVEAEKLKRGYIEPEDLIERLRKLKPSDNFELRKFCHPPVSWKSPTPLEEEPHEILNPAPEWLIHHTFAVSDMWRRVGHELTIQYNQEIYERWEAVKASIEMTPLPNSHLLRDMGRSPGGTLFPWYLVKGLTALRDHANTEGSKSYDEEYGQVKVKRKKVIDRWREKNPDSTLTEDTLVMYKNWPTDLMTELDELDRDAVRYGRRNYVAFLREAEEKMQTLVAFWRDCGLITGRRTPPSSWWQDPKAKVKRLPEPQCLKERFAALRAEFGYYSKTRHKMCMIETGRWIESVLNGNSRPAAFGTPLPRSLLDEMDIVYRECEEAGFCWDDIEDELIGEIRRWRDSKHQQRLEKGVPSSPPLESDIGPEQTGQMARSSVCLSRDSASGSAIAPEKTLQLREEVSGDARRRPQRNKTMAEDRSIWQGRLRSRTNHTPADGHTIWHDRLRPRRDAASASWECSNPAGKPKGIVKRHGRKASEKRRQVATRDEAPTATTQKADLCDLAGSRSHINESSPQAIPARAIPSTGTTNKRRQGLGKASTVPAGGIKRARNGKGRQTRKLLKAAPTT
ncbi:MAG: hypothetical protein M1837_002649 [Sclerophora amabilis]|nr:MAG: hypothetical protein M1837_002649 [Sclerophora amabilis]